LSLKAYKILHFENICCKISQIPVVIFSFILYHLKITQLY